MRVLTRRRRSRDGGEPPDRPPRQQPNDSSGASEQERRILAALADVRDMTVREVMTPRVDVVALPIPVHAADVARAVRESGHSAFPVYDEDLDHVVGVLHVNDLFRAGWQVDDGDANPGRRERPTSLEISRRLRQPYIVPESRPVLDALADMRRDRRAFAVVVDEYGGVAGVVSMKDLLAALVGELHDELDPGDEPHVVRVDRSRWLVDGGTPVDEVRERLGMPVPDGEYVTFAGFLFDALGRIPEEGDELDHEGWLVRVVEMDRRRIAKVVVHAPRANAASQGHTDASAVEGHAVSR
jgi:CBS domain containing-hemolysin-like protein